MDNRNGDAPAALDEATQRVKEAGGNALGDIKAAAGSAIGDAKDAAYRKAEDMRAKASDTGHTTAGRLRDLAGQVEGDLPWMATAFTKSADGLDNVTNSLTRGNLDECIGGVSEFARRQPAIFLGASVALGFALARVGKTALESGRPAPQPETGKPETGKMGDTGQPFDAASPAYPRPTGV